MINRYYQQQLSYLRELGALFSKKHPALAPMLAGQSADPDVERLLEGTAFLTGLIQERLDDNFPEIIHGLMELIFPHYLRPLPAATIVRFTPKAGLQEPVVVSRGTELLAQQVDGIQPVFTTCEEVLLLPLQICHTAILKSTIQIQLQLSAMTWAEVQQPRLRFYLSGDYNHTANLLAILNQSLNRVHLITDEIQLTLDARAGFDGMVMQDSAPLYPYPTHSFPAMQAIQEYFQLPHKFLFFDILGLQQLQTSDTILTINLELFPQVEVPAGNWQLALFCVPVVNLFKHHADTIFLDHTLPEYRINPAGGAAYQIYAVDRVVGFQQGVAQGRHYQPFALFTPQSSNVPVYSVRRRVAKLGDQGGAETYLSVAYPDPSLALPRETLAIQVRCTNIGLVQQLRYGDICLPSENSPVMATFSNITPLSAPVASPISGNLLWRLLSHLYLNQRTLTQQASLTALLKLYIFTDTPDRAALLANTKRVEAIREINVDSQQRMLYRGSMIRGSSIVIQLDPDGFSGSGDLFLFGAMLNRLLAAYSTLNSYTQVSIENIHDKQCHQWPALAGRRYLL